MIKKFTKGGEIRRSINFKVKGGEIRGGSHYKMNVKIIIYYINLLKG